MEIKDISAAFTRHLEVEGYASSTIICYRTYLSYFLVYLKERGIKDLRQVSSRTLRDYQLLIREMDIAEETRAMRIRPVKRLFSWLLAEHKLLLDPCVEIVETNRKGRKLPPVLSREQIRLLLVQPDISRPIPFRDRTIMETLYATGIRLNELVHLCLADLDPGGGTLTVRYGKGNRQRVVPSGKVAGDYLQGYLEGIRPLHALDPAINQLFLTARGTPVSGNTVRTFLYRYKKQAGISGCASPHSFRRSCASHLLHNGADIRYVQQLLGHSHIRTTQLYTRVYSPELKTTHARSHPQL